MNPLQLIPLALQDLQDAEKLTAAFASNDKAAAVAAVTDALPTVALLTGRTVEQLAEILTPERLGYAFEVAEAAPKIIAAVESAWAAHVASAPPPAAE